jgi:hypothetical protein
LARHRNRILFYKVNGDYDRDEPLPLMADKLRERLLELQNSRFYRQLSRPGQRPLRFQRTSEVRRAARNFRDALPPTLPGAHEIQTMAGVHGVERGVLAQHAHGYIDLAKVAQDGLQEWGNGSKGSLDQVMKKAAERFRR